MEIRMADKKDLQGILKLYLQPDVDDGQVLSTKDAEEIFDKMALYPDYHLYVVVIEEEIIGSFALAIMDNLAHMGAKSGLVEDVVVKNSLQNQGIGKEMMKFAIDICRQKNCYKVALSSNLKREIAHSFYENLGFKKHGYSFLTRLD